MKYQYYNRIFYWSDFDYTLHIMNEYILPDHGCGQKQDRRVQGRSKYEISMYEIAIKIRCVVARLAGGAQS